MTDNRTESEIKAYNLHVELSALLQRYNKLLEDTDCEPLFGKDAAAERAGRALYDNRPLADWEPPTPLALSPAQSNTPENSTPRKA